MGLSVRLSRGCKERAVTQRVVSQAEQRLQGLGEWDADMVGMDLFVFVF